jgi:hypothetical protein
MSYLSRYLHQVRTAFTVDRVQQAHLILCEGNSTDGTKTRLEALTVAEYGEINGDVTVITMDTTAAQFSSVDHPLRWRNLEHAWNTNLAHIEPSEFVVCVESDLIWDATVLHRMLAHLEAGVADVICPMLWHDEPRTKFYDTNAFVLPDGRHFQNFDPVIPDHDGSQFVTLKTGGGMLVMRGETAKLAQWRDRCRMHFPDGVKVVTDTTERIYHP